MDPTEEPASRDNLYKANDWRQHIVQWQGKHDKNPAWDAITTRKLQWQ
jgi:hypothetical protein